MFLLMWKGNFIPLFYQVIFYFKADQELQYKKKKNNTQ